MIRLLFTFLLAWGLLHALPASATEVPAKWQYRYCQSDVRCSDWQDFANVACNAWSIASPGWSVEKFPNPPGDLVCTLKNSSGTLSSRLAYTQRVCNEAEGFRLMPDGVTCTNEEPPPPDCPTGYVGPLDVTIYFASGPDLGSAIVGPVNSPTAAQGKEYCSPMNCIVTPEGPPNSCQQAQLPGANGYYRVSCNFPMNNVGGSCPASGEVPPTVAPEPSQPPPELGKCPAGSVASGQDSMGMTICVGTAKPPTPPTTTTEKPEVTTPNPDGGSTTTKQTTTTNSDGSTTTTTTTTVTAPDGTKTITVDASTTPRTDGAAGTEDKPEDKSDLCKQNPHLNVCKNSQVIGTCGQVTCSGDAIQCATLRAAAAMECKQREDADYLSKTSHHALGMAVAAGNDPDSATLPGPKNAAAVSLPASLDGSGWLGGGAPFPDKTFTVQGQTITIPFSEALGYLVGLRYALMIVALLVSFRILSGAIIRE